jgi:hypothetical protein
MGYAPLHMVSRVSSSLRDLWRVPAYLPYLEPKLTSRSTARAEKALGVRLSRLYLAMLRLQNGGYLRRTFPDLPHRMIWGIGPHFPGIADGRWTALCDEAESADDGRWHPREARKLVPFDGDGHWYLCFDYRKSGPRREPAIAYVDLELGHERRIAPSFAAFVDALVEDAAEPTLGLCTALTLARAAKKLGEALGAPFEDQGDFDHGYRTYRCRLGRASAPAWAWLSENRVVRGWARRGERNFAGRRTLLPGKALRWPAHPECSLVLVSSAEVAQRLSKACTKLGIETVAMVAGR